MPHIDPDDIALLALGEPAGLTATEHLANCGSCRAEIESLTQVVLVGRQSDPRDLLVAPPPGLWDAITAELGLPSGAFQAPGESATATAPEAQLRAVPDISPAQRTSLDHGPSPQGPSSSVPPARRARSWRGASSLALAAAVGAILGTGITALVTRPANQPATSDAVVAQAVLAPISAQATQPGTATASDGPDGLEVRVDARGLPALDGFYEVWLLDEDATRLFALGALPAGSVGTFTVPPGVSLSDFPVVDVSLEPYDGDPRHSHASLLRGTLEV